MATIHQSCVHARATTTLHNTLPPVQPRINSTPLHARVFSARTDHRLALDNKGCFLISQANESTASTAEKATTLVTRFNQKLDADFSVSIPKKLQLSPQVLDGKILSQEFINKNSACFLVNTCYASDGTFKEFDFKSLKSWTLNSVICSFTKNEASPNEVVMQIVGSNGEVMNASSLDIEPAHVCGLKFVPSKEDQFAIYNPETRKLYIGDANGIKTSLTLDQASVSYEKYHPYSRDSFGLPTELFTNHKRPMDIKLIGDKIIFVNSKGIQIMTPPQGAEPASIKTIAHCFATSEEKLDLAILDLENGMVCVETRTWLETHSDYEETTYINFTIFNIKDTSAKPLNLSGFKYTFPHGGDTDIVGFAQLAPDFYAIADKKRVFFFTKETPASRIDLSPNELANITEIKKTDENKLLVVGKGKDGLAKVVEIAY